MKKEQRKAIELKISDTIFSVLSEINQAVATKERSFYKDHAKTIVKKFSKHCKAEEKRNKKTVVVNPVKKKAVKKSAATPVKKASVKKRARR